MAMVHVQNCVVGFGGGTLLDGVDLPLERGDRVCLVGRNGAGKTTLMRIISGELPPDSGLVVRQPGMRITRLPQEVPTNLTGTVREIVATGLGQVGDPDHGDDWQVQQRITLALSRLDLDGEAPFATLSSGLKRRVLLARAVAPEPDLLLLDEPTNHLDLPAIERLEEVLADFRGGVLFITHDRALLRRLATRIVELDRGRLFSWPGSYDDYLRRKQAALETEARQWEEFDKKLAQEERWIRQGIQARRTRNQGRVENLIRLRRQRQARLEGIGQARMVIQEAQRSGKLVVETEGVHYGYQGVRCIREFSTLILRGEKVGIIGPNGCGKTTLLQILLGQLSPERGEVRLGTRLEVAYFDQNRSQLDDMASVADNVAHGRERIDTTDGSRHIIGYLGDFLFTPDRARSPVRILSGGERNRLLLARLFAQPANLLVLDEPTNDLDAETLDLLEERLLEFSGTVLLVSHDRAFLDNVVTTLLVFEGDGRIREYVGGYSDWIRQRPAASPTPPSSGKPPVAANKPPATKAPAPSEQSRAVRKLGFKEVRELELLPGRIEALEAEQTSLHQTMAAADFFRQEKSAIRDAHTRLERLEGELTVLYARWEELEAIQHPKTKAGFAQN
ncbi:MAG: ATP-binding cassette domain-containing protein [Magnetococcales bacterium]|nr:ATP-binding cassette domain-containing protein [Magnetococcales bacterium]